jgi:hypothetical protein
MTFIFSLFSDKSPDTSEDLVYLHTHLLGVLCVHVIILTLLKYTRLLKEFSVSCEARDSKEHLKMAWTFYGKSLKKSTFIYRCLTQHLKPCNLSLRNISKWIQEQRAHHSSKRILNDNATLDIINVQPHILKLSADYHSCMMSYFSFSLHHSFLAQVWIRFFNCVAGIMTLTRTPCEFDTMSLFQDLKLKRRKVDSRCSSDGQ